MGFFSFLKKKPAEKKSGIEPLNLNVNLPPIESVRPSPSASLTPEVPSSGIPPLEPMPSFGQPQAERPEAFREAESFRGEASSKDLSRSLELLSAKLDNIKLMIEGLNHRLDRLEAEKKKETIRW
jgi:hypothetical protein